MNLLLAALFLGTLQVTAYRSVPGQTDNSPWVTSIGERVNNHGVAVSQDLLIQNGGPLAYGDLLYIEGIGWKIANDCMNSRYKNRLDIWVSSLDEEKKFHARFKAKHLKVWVIHSTLKENLHGTRQIKRKG